MDDPDFYYKLRTDTSDGVASRFHPKAGKTLTERKWRDAFDRQGRLDISKVLIRIQRGGVHPLIRGEVWEFLLGCFDPDSTYAERAALRKSRREKYLRIKAECRAMDSAVGSGLVATLPRINEDGSSIDNQRQRDIKNGSEPSINGHGGGNIRDDFSKRDMLPRSLLSLLQQDDEREERNLSEQIQADNDGYTKQVEGHSVSNRRRAQLHRSQPVRIGNAAGSLESNGRTSQASSTGTSRSLDNRPNEKRVATGEVLQDKIVIQWRLILHQVGLDVVRTDRTLQFYEKPENLAKLWDILAVYAWIDPDIGYCQGMSDLCSPMVVLFQSEADAFWCFEHLMNRLRENFRCTEQAVGVQKQLANLGSILQVVDPKLHRHLDELGGGSYIFAFRMVMVLFRREFSFADSLYLWEIMWALEYDPQLRVHEANFQQQQVVQAVSRQEFKSGWIVRKEKSLYRWGKFERQNIKYGHENSVEIPFVVFCAASIFESQRARLQEAPGLDEVVKILNEITGKLDAKKACQEALKIHKKYLLKAKKIE